MSNTIDLAKELISKKSITPDDAGCQNLIADRLGKIGFSIEHLKYGDVDNLCYFWRFRPSFCFSWPH